MKKIYYTIFLILTIWQLYAQDSGTWGPMTNNFQMSIELKNNVKVIKTNQPCILTIRYKSVSTNEMFQVYEVNGTVYDPTYAFIVISPSGKDISPDLKKFSPESGQNHTIAPGQTVKIEFDLSHFCKFDEIGTYRVIAKKTRTWSTEKNQSFTVISNPLNITVTN